MKMLYGKKLAMQQGTTKGISTQKGTMKQRILSLFLVFALITAILPLSGTQVAKAAENVITSMAYYSPNDGPVLSKSGVGEQSYGFVMPIFNGGAASWTDVVNDLTVYVRVNGTWMNIDNTNFVYNANWGNWNDSGFNGYWFIVSETTYIRLASKANGITLDYILEFTDIPTTTIHSMTPTQGPELTAGPTGSLGFTYPMFNGNSAIPYEAVKNDLVIYIKTLSDNTWVKLFDNAASGWIYDQNFGQFTDGGGGLWFQLTESVHVRFESISSEISLIYTLNYSEPVRNSYTLSSYDGTTYTAGETGAIGVPLPKIDGGAAVRSEIDNFVYQIKVNGIWIELSDYSKSNFSYSGHGYNNLSDKNQWGYFVDYIYGLWFQPVQEDIELRIGYPMNGIKGGDIGSNYIYYNFIGNPNAPRPDVSDLGNIELSSPENPNISGNVLIWNDEFTGASLDTSKWNYETGYYLNDDPNTWGWGNNELEHYTDSSKNVYIKDGKLNITAYTERKSFPQDPNRYAEYSSGKITTQNRFDFTYGRIDFRAKLPRGTGLWPALWMLPNDDTYGTWAASGEIDVMEARGRIPEASSGAIHYGGTWPANTYIGSDYAFPEGQSIDTDFHVYSLVWEEDNMKWYVDGQCFFKVTSDQWYSNGALDNPKAPFDQPFYIIMNLAVGGWFDGGVVPNVGDIPATMEVDYVRVYKPEGSGYNPGEDPQPIEVSGVTLNKTSVIITEGEDYQLNAIVMPADATNKTVSWSVDKSNIVAVDQTGKVTGVSPGTTSVTVRTADGNKTATCQITVQASAEHIEYIVGDEVKGIKRINDTIEFYVNGATFADIHYKINNGAQINIGMNSGGNGNYTYQVKNLKQGDVVDYFFTYNPGQGALDTPWFTYIHGVTQGTPQNPDPTQPVVYEKISSGKAVVTSSNENESFNGDNIVDDNVSTRWSSAFSENEWIYIDLGKVTKVNKVILHWEAAYGKNYEIQVSTDKINWNVTASVNNSDGGIDEIYFDSVSARYIRMQGIQRALPYGYSLYEMKVYGVKN